MQLLTVNSMGITERTGRNNQSIALDAVVDPFTVDSRRSIVYHIDSNNLMSVNLNIMNSAEVSEHYIENYLSRCSVLLYHYLFAC